MKHDPSPLILENDSCRLVATAAGSIFEVSVQVQLEGAWQTVATLPPPALEYPALPGHPGGRVQAPYTQAGSAGGTLELTAQLEQGGSRWEIRDQVSPAISGFEVRRTWRHTGQTEPQVALLFETVYPGLEVDFWMIPGLMYQGNPMGCSGYHQTGNGAGPQPGLPYPSGWDLGGVPWVFSEETTIPSATWLRRGRTALGVFAQPQASLHDLLSAASLVRSETAGEIRSTVYLPSRDLPLLYRDKNGFTPGRVNWLCVVGAWQYQRSFFISATTAEPALALAGFNRAAWAALAPFRHLPRFSFDEVQALRTNFLMTYHLRQGPDYCGLIQGLYHDGSVRENWMSDGFLSLNAEFASFLYAYAHRTHDPARVEIARRIAEFFTSAQFENGLFCSNYFLDRREWGSQFGGKYTFPVCFTRPMGERLWNLLELAELLEPSDPLHARILAFCRRSAQFFLENQLPNGSFGKIWSADGRLLDDSGANFTFITWFLCRLYACDPNPAYLQAAERSFERIRAIFDSLELDDWVDCLDSAAIDREGAAAFLQALNALYELTGKPETLHYARQAAEVALTWQYTYDVWFEVDTPLGGRMFARTPSNPADARAQDGVSVKPPAEMVFHTAGMTLVSVEHPCLDAWGARLGYELLRLARFSGDQQYWERGCAAVMAAQQVIARQPGDFGLNLVGAQPEQMNSRDWAYGYIALGKGAARVLIAWNQVLNLATLERIRRQMPEALDWMQVQ